MPEIPTDQITDAYMHDRIGQARRYSLVVLRTTQGRRDEDASRVVWEHGRRNMALQAAGTMPIVCPVGDEELAGIGILDTGPDEARAIMAGDPGVRAGLFTFEVHTCRGFPGDALPGAPTA